MSECEEFLNIMKELGHNLDNDEWKCLNCGYIFSFVNWEDTCGSTGFRIDYKVGIDWRSCDGVSCSEMVVKDIVE